MMDWQIAIAAVGIVGSGVSAWIGVRVALAETRADVRWIKETVKEAVQDFNIRIGRLERPYFEGKD